MTDAASMSQKPRLRAKVTFLGPDQCGRKTPPRSGTRSQLKVGDICTSCIIHGRTADQVFEFGVEHDVTIELLFWDQVRTAIYVGMPAELSEGSRQVGYGTVDAIVSGRGT